MQFDAGTWWLIGILAAAVIAFLSALFTRSVFGKIDENSKDIKKIHQEYTPRSEHIADIKEVRVELKNDLKALREEQRGETQKLASDIEDIRENCLRNDNFVRTISKLENKIDLLFEKILSGGNRNG